jgi:hypothetical protein
MGVLTSSTRMGMMMNNFMIAGFACLLWGIIWGLLGIGVVAVPLLIGAMACHGIGVYLVWHNRSQK